MKRQSVLIFMPLLLVGSITGCKNKNSSNTNTGSNSQTSGTKVTEKEYKDAIENFGDIKNMTVDFNLAIKASTESAGVYQIISQEGTQKIDNLKLSYETKSGFIQEVTKEGFESLYAQMGAVTDEQKEAAYNQLVNNVSSSGGIILEQKEDYLKVAMMISSEINYGKKIENEDIFVIDYQDTGYIDGQYYESKKFVEDSDSYGLQTVEQMLTGLNDSNVYKLLTYSKEDGAYTITDIDVASAVFGTDLAAEGISDVKISISFDGKDLSSFSISAADDKQLVTESFVVKNKGTTQVSLPTNILVCDHEAYGPIFDDYVSDYHYSECYECDSVLRYEAHTYDHHVCTKCGGHESRSRVSKALDLGDEHMNSHFRYYEDTEGNAVDADIYDFDSTYDSTLGKYVYTCHSHECDLKLIQDYKYESLTENKCIEKNTYIYKFYHGESTTPFKTFEYVRYQADHEFDYSSTDDSTNPCITHNTKTCTSCGYSDSYQSAYHTTNDTYSVNGCLLITKSTCEDCGKETIKESVSHKLLKIGEKTTEGYLCHCDECNKDFVYSLYFYESGNYGHYVSNHTTGSYYRLPHEYDEENHCKLCGYDKRADHYDVEWVYCYYEGAESIYINLNSDGERSYISSTGFDYEYDSETGISTHTARYTDYSYTEKSSYNDETGWCTEIVIKKGETVVLEYTY